MLIDPAERPTAVVEDEQVPERIRQRAPARVRGVVAAPFASVNQSSVPLAFVALLALGGSFAWEYVWVEAGQSVPLS